MYAIFFSFFSRRSLKRSVFGLSSLLFAFALFSSCNNENKAAEKKRQVLRTAIHAAPVSFDPRKSTDITSANFAFLLFEGLTLFSPDGSIVPAQAESVDLSEDKTCYTFHLRESFWSDGTPVTAFDFEYSWKEMLSPSFPAPSAYLLYPVVNAEKAKRGLISVDEVGITATDSSTLVVRLSAPTPHFLEILTFYTFSPIQKSIDQTKPNWSQQVAEDFISNGPFILKERKGNHYYVLEKNPLYYAKNKIKLDSISFSLVENEMTALQMYEKGEIDILGHPFSPIPVDALPKLQKEGVLHINPSPLTTFSVFNTQTFPFSNSHLRKAFALATNREAIVQNITQLNELPATAAIPPLLKQNHNRKFFNDHDLQNARYHLKLALQELGVKASDLKITYTYSTTDLSHKIAQALQQQWATNLGISITLEQCDHKILLDKLSKRTFIAAQTLWYAQYFDPINILERFKSPHNVKNYAAWDNASFSHLLDRSSYASSPALRRALLEQAEELFLEEMPVSPIYHWNTATLIKPYVKNIHFNPLGGLHTELLEIDMREEGAR